MMNVHVPSMDKECTQYEESMNAKKTREQMVNKDFHEMIGSAVCRRGNATK